MAVLSDLIRHFFDKEGTHQLFWAFYLANVVLSIIAYKLGFARTLPLLKSFFVYICLFIGVFVITIFSIMDLPITEALFIVSLVLVIYRTRLHFERKNRQQKN
ncbi:MAG TPA: YlaH-like family protein [Pseudogracilibacillus sp.]|nr:YlaH-like family protein [Pseudogracilibacillus sp.]